MSQPIAWTYDAWYRWYRKRLGDDALHIIGAVYEARRPKKKDLASLEPFLKRHMAYAGSAPVQNRESFPEGLYTLIEAEPTARKWVFFVFPQWVERVLVGNHLTFVVELNDKKKGCHFHSTYYTCTQPTPGMFSWLDPHYKDYFPTSLQLPRRGLLHNPVHQGYRETILSLMREPWRNGESPSRSAGGAKRRSSDPPALPIRSQAFSAIWLDRGYRQMVAIGIPEAAGGIQWSVCIRRSGRDRIGVAYVFSLPADADETRFQQELAARILHMEPDG